MVVMIMQWEVKETEKEKNKKWNVWEENREKC